MKRLIIFAFILSCVFSTQAQKKFGIRAGLSSTDFNPKDLVVMDQNDVDQLTLAVDDASVGFHLGLFYQYRKKKFFIQPEILLQSNRVDYKVENFENNAGETIFSERYNFVDIPINAGLKLGPLRLQAGPVGHFFINSFSELKDIEGYEEKFDAAALGVQYGLGLDIWRMVLDFKWEKNFRNFDDSPDRFIVSLGIKF